MQENILTYRQIQNVIKEIVDNHPQINNVFFLKPADIEDSEKQFPMLFVEYLNTYLPINSKTNTFT